MLFWIFVTVIALLVAALILRPLWLEPEEGAADLDALDVYKRQLETLERDVEAGTVPASEAEATRTEIERRMLAADKDMQATHKAPSKFTRNQRITMSVVVALLLPLGALTLYALFGAPGYGDLPHKARCEALSQTGPKSQEDMVQLVDCLAVRMDKNPRPEGLAMLGRSYMTMGRYSDATRAYARAVEIGGASIENLEGLGLSIVYLNQGAVTDDAHAAFREAAKLQGDTTFAKFYLAEYDYQHGKQLEALSAWVDLLEVTPRDNPMYDVLNERIQRGIADQQAASEAPAASGEAAAPVAQSEQVKAMVAGLAAKLEENPHDLNGWLMLIRSYHVQGRDPEAEAALSKATLNFITEPEALQQLMSLSDELGLNPAPEAPLPSSE